MAHMASSSSMLIVNKAAVASFPPCFLIIYQALVTIIVLGVQGMETMSFVKIVQWMPVVTLFASMLMTSTFALEQIPVQTLIVFRNLTALGVAFGEYFFLKKTVSWSSVGCIVVMIVGAVQYSQWDAHFNALGYFWAIANTLCTACYNLFAKSTITRLNMSTASSTMYNNVLCLPFLFATAFFTREFEKLPATFSNMDPASIAVLVISGFIGYGISYAGFAVQSLVSATSFTVVVNVSKVLSIIISGLLFKTFPGPEASVGLAISLLGGWLYASVNSPGTANKSK